MLVADLNGDGWEDIVFGSVGVYFYRPDVQAFSGQALFVDAFAIENNGFIHSVNDFSLVDLDGDGVVNLVLPSNEVREAWLYLDPGSVFGQGWNVSNISSRAEEFRFADLNSDGLTDVVAKEEESVVVWVSRGDGQFEPWRFGVDLDLNFVTNHTPLGADWMVPKYWPNSEGGESSRSWFVNYLFGGNLRGNIASEFVASGHGIVSGDYDGDGSEDHLVYYGNEAIVHFTQWNHETKLKAVESGGGVRHEVAYGGGQYEVSNTCAGGASAEYDCRTSPSVLVESVSLFERANAASGVGGLRPVSKSEYTFGDFRHGRGGRGSFGPAFMRVRNTGYEGYADTVHAGYDERTYNNTSWLLAGTERTARQTTPSNVNSLAGYQIENLVKYSWGDQESADGRPFPTLEGAETILTVFRNSGPATTLSRGTTEQHHDSYGNVTSRTTRAYQPGAPVGGALLATTYEEFCFAHAPRP